MQKVRWTIHHLAEMPIEEGKRYEIIDGDLYVTTQPHSNHQHLCVRVATFLDLWTMENDSGTVLFSPGVIFTEDNNVAPDVAWMSNERYVNAIGTDGHFYLAPELTIEVLSPGVENEKRDRESKRSLYSRQGVIEYWIISWPTREIEIYRRLEPDAPLELFDTLHEGDVLNSPLLSGFSCKVSQIFKNI